MATGEMRVVGPRPELPQYVASYRPQERNDLRTQPGITDPATIRYRRESETLARHDDPEAYYREVVVREKLAINIEYAAEATIWTDLVVLLQTLRAVTTAR